MSDCTPGISVEAFSEQRQFELVSPEYVVVFVCSRIWYVVVFAAAILFMHLIHVHGPGAKEMGVKADQKADVVYFAFCVWKNVKKI